MTDLPHLTICYVTGRREPRFEWFVDSLERQVIGSGIRWPRLVIVDYWAERNGDREEIVDPAERIRYFATRMRSVAANVYLVPPKPCVWQGAHRLTRTNYFAAANARNTGLCYAPDGWIAYADDLAVLVPGWLDAVHRAMREGFVAMGAYRKVPGMIVEKGRLIHPIEPRVPRDAHGVDSRWAQGDDAEPRPLTGAALYGCSVAMPVDALLATNGWDERADARGMGGEDYLTGILLERNGYAMRYCRQMLTVEEDVATPSPFEREIATAEGRPDASHVLLGLVRDHEHVRMAPNYFPEGGIRAVRERVLAEGYAGFPPAQIPEHDWYSGTPLREL